MVAGLTSGLVLACGEDEGRARSTTPIGRRPATQPSSDDSRQRAYPARRCGECHQRTTQAWAASRHALADRSEVYRAMREASGRRDCDRCHAPLRLLLPDDEGLGSEGVTCDVCHTLVGAEADPRGGALQLDLTSAIRYASLCNAEDHYFHKMGCLPLYTQAKLCGGCHLWTTHTTATAELEVLTTYTDWSTGPYAAVEQTCQGCHMAATAGEIAVGWGTRASASDHAMFGADHEMRRRALSVELAVTDEPSAVEVELHVTNDQAGHPLPAGFPARRIVVRVATLADDGAVIERQERTYARILVDARGVEVPFYQAARVQSDTRIHPHERRREHFSFPREGVTAVQVEILDHPVSTNIARAIGVEPPEPFRLAHVRAEAAQGGWKVRAP